MYSLVDLKNKKNNLKEVDISNIPLKVYLDEDSKTLIFDSEYDIVFNTSGNIVQSAKGKNVILGGEVHLNPKIDVLSSDYINKDKLQR